MKNNKMFMSKFNYFVIFGWGFQTTKYFGVEDNDYLCPICRNVVNRHLLRVRVWFSLFFIPVFPYSSKYYCLCPICEKGIELTKSEVDELIDYNKPKELEQQPRLSIDINKYKRE